MSGERRGGGGAGAHAAAPPPGVARPLLDGSGVYAMA
jgi:hypothetical protein